MRYPYYDASDGQFENLTCEICTELLGPGVQSFSTGPDGGRDAAFCGTAHRFPSPNDPWTGSFVIQAKHTENPVAKFSDSDFSGHNNSSTIAKELSRIKCLVDKGECDHYLLFANRRLAGDAEQRIRNHIKNSTGAQNVSLFGIDQINRLVQRYPNTIDRAGLSELKYPLRVTPDDLATVITAFDRHAQTFNDACRQETLHRAQFDTKNVANNISREFAQLIKRDYLREFGTVRQFLAHPENEEVRERYNEAVAEFREQIVTHHPEGTPLNETLLNIQWLLFQRDSDLANRKRLTKLVLYYMYYMCDIGKDPTLAKADQAH